MFQTHVKWIGITHFFMLDDDSSNGGTTSLRDQVLCLVTGCVILLIWTFAVVTSILYWQQQPQQQQQQSQNQQQQQQQQDYDIEWQWWTYATPIHKFNMFYVSSGIYSHGLCCCYE